MAKPSFDFSVSRADNGYVIEYRKLSPTGSSLSNNTRIVPEGETVGDHINSILVSDRLESAAPSLAAPKKRTVNRVHQDTVETIMAGLDDMLNQQSNNSL